jgi:hypothetical protein
VQPAGVVWNLLFNTVAVEKSGGVMDL